MAIIGCVLFVGCNKFDDGLDSKEDLSYVIRTYYRYENNNQIIKQTWTYDGYKETGYKYYVDGVLLNERTNYSYNGLNASWDYYNYSPNSTIIRQHVECEYLDETYRRVKYQKTQYYFSDSQNNYLYETYYEYDGKKKLSYQSFRNGVLDAECHYDYVGLRCTYTTTDYSNDNIIWQERSYEILYLDDSYFREKTRLQTRKRYNEYGELTTSNTYYSVYDYEGKKPIGYQYFVNGQLSSVNRDYHYDGLSCYYFNDIYQDGEVYSSTISEVEYLE